MAKYIFIKDYTEAWSETVRGLAQPIQQKTFKTGDVIEGVFHPGNSGINPDPASALATLNGSVSTTISGMMPPPAGMVGGEKVISIPFVVLKETTNPVNINPVTTFSRTHQKEILFSAIGAAIGSYVAYRHKGGTADYILYAGGGAAAGLLIANVLIKLKK